MNRVRRSSIAAGSSGVLLLAVVVAACSTQAKSAKDPDPSTSVEPLAITLAAVESAPIDRFLRVTGSLLADEQAEVSAETAGRVVATPVERGTRVSQGTLLIRISGSETHAQLLEAEANAAQIEARLGLTAREPFDPASVPDVMNARASLDLAEAEFNRIKSLLDQKVVSQSEYDQRQAQVEVARQQYQVARNSAEQSYRSLDAARARVSLAQKSVDDTLIRAPFSGVVAERLVSVGDYVSRGTRALVPSAAVETVSGTSRVYVASGGKIEERIVTIGETVGDRIELTSGVVAGEAVASAPKGRLIDGRAVAVR